MPDDAIISAESLPPRPPPEPAPHRGLALHWQILIGLAFGAIAGLLANAFVPREADGSPNETLLWIVDNVAHVIGQVFLRLIFMVVIPLVFTALVLGVTGIGDVRQLGRLGLRTLLYTLVLSGASVAIGLTLANVVRPGDGLSEEKRDQLKARFAKGGEAAVAQAKKAKPLRDVILDIIPRNPFQEAVGSLDGSSPGGGMLAVMFFALFFGVALSLAPARAGPVIAVLEGTCDAIMVIIGIAMKLAPLGVAALVFSLTAVLGLDVVTALGRYVATVVVGLGLQMFLVYPIVLLTFARLSPGQFFGNVSDAMLTAFATSSSNATLPTALRVAEENLRCGPTSAASC